MSGGPAPFLSQRLSWSTGQNRLSQREAEHRGAGRALLDLTVSNPTQVGLPYPDAALVLGPSNAVYEPAPFGLLSARQLVAAEQARYGVTVDVSAIALTASSSESYALLFKLLADPGSAVLVPQPSYPLFDYLARLEGLEPRPYRLVYDGRWSVDWDSVQLDGVRAICLVNPNNPTGSFIARDELARWAALASERGIALVVDEVFADYPLAPAADAVIHVAAAKPTALTFSLGGLSKAYGLPQMKLGWITVTGPASLVEAACAALELVCDTYLSVGTPVQRALPVLLEAGLGIRGRIGERVRTNRATLEALVVAPSACTLLPCEGGWSAIVRVPSVLSDEEWALAFLDREGVLVQPGYFFDLTGGTHLVLSLLVEPEILAEGARRIVNHVDAR